MRILRFVLPPLLVPLAFGLVWEDGTGKLPAMGWNSWNTYECNISAALFLDQAQVMIDYGFLVRKPRGPVPLHPRCANLMIRTLATTM